MLGFFIGLLTAIMVLDCIVLVFLVLIQLPKKEAGAGLAFGGSATDALFGAGSGNVLTKITKYAAGIFFVLAIGLSLMRTRYFYHTTSEFEQQLQQAGPPAATMPVAPAPAPTAPGPTATPAPSTPAVPFTVTNAAPTAPAAEQPAPPAAATSTNAAPAPAAPK